LSWCSKIMLSINYSFNFSSSISFTDLITRPSPIKCNTELEVLYASIESLKS